MVAHSALRLCLSGESQGPLQIWLGELFHPWRNILSWATHLHTHAPGFPCRRRCDCGPSQARHGSSSAWKFKVSSLSGQLKDSSCATQPLVHAHTRETTAQSHNMQLLLGHFISLSTSDTYQTELQVIQSRSVRATLFSYIGGNSNRSPEQVQDFPCPALAQHPKQPPCRNRVLPEAVIKVIHSCMHTYIYGCNTNVSLWS